MDFGWWLEFAAEELKGDKEIKTEATKSWAPSSQDGSSNNDDDKWFRGPPLRGRYKNCNYE